MIVTAVGGLKETIGDTGTGIVAPDVSAECIRAEIARYFSDPSIRENCVSHIRKEKQRLSWGNFSRDLTDFSEKL